MIAHAYGLFNGSFSHDALNALYASASEDAWKIELGRFVVPVYRLLVRGAFNIPWLIGLIGFVFIGCAVYFVTEIFGMTSKPITVLTAGIMITNITVISQIATYCYEFDFNALSLLLAVAAAYYWKNHCGIKGLLTGCILLIISIGIYQSYFSMTVIIIIAVSVMDLLNKTSARTVMIKGLKGAGMVGAGCVLYYVINRIVCIISSVPLNSRVDVLASDGAFSASDFINLIADVYTEYLHKLFEPIIYPVWLVAFIAAVVILEAILSVFICVKRRCGISQLLLSAVLIILFPFGANAICFLTGNVGVHQLMTYSVYFTYVLMMYFICTICRQQENKPRILKYLKSAVCVFAAVLICQNTVLSNTAYLKKGLEEKSALSLMTRVLSRIEDTDGYVIGETEIAFIGVPRYETAEGFKRINFITGNEANNPIYMDTSVYYYNTYKAYFEYVLDYPVKLCSDETNAELHKNEEVIDMPCFPDKASVKTIDGVLVVKLGETDN